MAIEGAWRAVAARRLARRPRAVRLAKALKAWAISSLGPMELPRAGAAGAPLITSGPYRFISHPNYVAVVGELVGVAAIVSAPITGAGCIGFGWLMRARIRVEDHALGRPMR